MSSDNAEKASRSPVVEKVSSPLATVTNGISTAVGSSPTQQQAFRTPQRPPSGPRRSTTSTPKSDGKKEAVRRGTPKSDGKKEGRSPHSRPKCGDSKCRSASVSSPTPVCKHHSTAQVKAVPVNNGKATRMVCDAKEIQESDAAEKKRKGGSAKSEAAKSPVAGASKKATKPQQATKSKKAAKVPELDVDTKSLSQINADVNNLFMEQLRALLSNLQLDEGGIKEVLRKRIKNHYRKNAIAMGTLERVSETFLDYFCVMDVEATCHKEQPDGFVPEPIELAVVIVNSLTRKVEGRFHSYCRPTLEPKLSEFCTELTGITQVNVDKADTFDAVLRRLIVWVGEKLNGKTFAFVTDGDADIRNFLAPACERSALELPIFWQKWVNLRNGVANFYRLNMSKFDIVAAQGQKLGKLRGMLHVLGLPHHGRMHSGRDDAENMSRILQVMLRDGCCLRLSKAMNLSPGDALAKPQVPLAKPLVPTAALVKSTGAVGTPKDLAITESSADAERRQRAGAQSPSSPVPRVDPNVSYAKAAINSDGGRKSLSSSPSASPRASISKSRKAGGSSSMSPKTAPADAVTASYAKATKTRSQSASVATPTRTGSVSAAPGQVASTSVSPPPVLLGKTKATVVMSSANATPDGRDSGCCVSPSDDGYSALTVTDSGKTPPCNGSSPVDDEAPLQVSSAVQGSCLEDVNCEESPCPEAVFESVAAHKPGCGSEGTTTPPPCGVAVNENDGAQSEYSEEPLVAAPAVEDRADCNGAAEQPITDTADCNGAAEQPITDTADCNGAAEQPITDTADCKGAELPAADSNGAAGHSAADTADCNNVELPVADTAAVCSSDVDGEKDTESKGQPEASDECQAVTKSSESIKVVDCDADSPQESECTSTGQNGCVVVAEKSAADMDASTGSSQGGQRKNCQEPCSPVTVRTDNGLTTAL
eukprot:scpid32295/ scgid5220/ 3&apos; 3&apos; Eri-1 homolog; Histone mRNA 3&apos; Histone mRNA 3&apos; Protein 3&apos